MIITYQILSMSILSSGEAYPFIIIILETYPLYYQPQLLLSHNLSFHINNSKLNAVLDCSLRLSSYNNFLS
jgi:hypothetical protein